MFGRGLFRNNGLRFLGRLNKLFSVVDETGVKDSEVSFSSTVSTFFGAGEETGSWVIDSVDEAGAVDDVLEEDGDSETANSVSVSAFGISVTSSAGLFLDLKKDGLCLPRLARREVGLRDEVRAPVAKDEVEIGADVVEGAELEVDEGEVEEVVRLVLLLDVAPNRPLLTELPNLRDATVVVLTLEAILGALVEVVVNLVTCPDSSFFSFSGFF